MAQVSEHRGDIEIVINGKELEDLSAGKVVSVVDGMQAIFIRVGVL
jgi:hypothetical protein